MASVADTYGIPILAALATHPGITGHNDFISQTCFDDTFQGAVAALYVRDELLLDKVAVFSNPNSNHSSFLAAEFERVYKSIGGRVTDTIFLSEQTKDYADILKGVRAKNPELLYVPVKAIDVIQVSKAVNSLGWKPIAMTSDGVGTNVLTQYTEELDQLEGIMATDFFHSAMPLTPFGNMLKSAFQESATSYSVLGAEGYAILFSAMNRCNDPENSTCINREIRSTTDFEGVMGKITIDVNGRAQRPLVVNVIENGRMKFLVKVY